MSASERIVVLAPFASDGPVIRTVLLQAGLTTELPGNLTELMTTLEAGAGAVLLTEEALTPSGLQRLADLLAEQPSWSDLPVLLLLTKIDLSRPDAARYGELLSSNPSVTVLRRPVPSITLVTAVQSALRARRRQYEVRDLLMKERLAREAAEAATRIKDEFLASVSHELRTPLNAILIWAQLLAAERLNGEQAGHAMRAIVSSAEAQSRLIEDLLDIARMLTGKLRLEIGPCDLAPIVLASTEVVRPTADAKGVQLDVRLEPSSAFVQGDAHRLQQIFWNLLSNAVKFTAAPGIVAVRLLSEANWLEVTVTDSGEGIEPEFLPHVFERFGQGSQQGDTLRKEGLGLGLSIVRQLVELHGGTVRAASAGRGQGCTFSVRLPAATAEPSSEPARTSSSAAPTLNGARVLLEANGTDTALALSWLLERAGAHVTQVDSSGSGQASPARQQGASHHDVLVSDLGASGALALAKLRDRRRQEQRTGALPLPAIAISGHPREEERRQALEAGYQVYLAMPLAPGALEAAITGLLGAKAPA